MAKLLDKVIARARRLPPKEQDALGAIILEELVAEELWSRKFAATQAALEKLADAALDDIKAGRTTPLRFPKRR
jgi:hypothetical protein